MYVTFFRFEDIRLFNFVGVFISLLPIDELMLLMRAISCSRKNFGILFVLLKCLMYVKKCMIYVNLFVLLPIAFSIWLKNISFFLIPFMHQMYL